MKRTRSSAGSTIHRYERAVRKNREIIKKGKLLAIDPSSGSRSSMPGYALYKRGNLETCGMISIPLDGVNRHLYKRLRYLNQSLEMFKTVDVLLIEEIPLKGGGRAISGHISLLQAVGVIIASVQAGVVIPVPICVWKKNLSPDYKKTDVNDALALATTTLNLANREEERK